LGRGTVVTASFSDKPLSPGFFGPKHFFLRWAPPAGRRRGDDRRENRNLYRSLMDREDWSMTDSKFHGSFAELLEAELRRLRRTPEQIKFLPGQVILQEGDFGDGLYLLHEGIVRISRALPGKEGRVLSMMGPGDFFGELAVIDEQPRSATATAETDARVSFIPCELVWEFLGRSPELLVAMMREIIRRMRAAEQRFLEETLEAGRLALVGRFAQAIVHDLQSPLSTISIAASVACADDSKPEDRREAGLAIQKQVDHLASRINEVLEFTRGTTGSARLTPAKYSEVVRYLVGECERAVAGRRVDIVYGNEPPALVVLLDAGRLLHVFLNLIGNAADAMPAGGKITLRFLATDSEVITEVEDTGSGVADEILPRVFAPFTTHGKPQGTGLGLSICKRIVEDHGGRLRVRNEPGKGAVFYFSLKRHN
jgi:signal transduction histidine kinase